LPLKGKTQAVPVYRVDWQRSPSDTWPKTPAASDTLDVSSVAETLARVQQHLARKGEERG